MANPPDNQPATVKEAYRLIDQNGDELVETAPPRLGSAVRTLVEGARKLMVVLEPIGYDLSKLDPTTSDVLADNRFQQASTQVFKYQNQVCAQGTTTTTNR